MTAASLEEPPSARFCEAARPGIWQGGGAPVGIIGVVGCFAHRCMTLG